MNKRKFVSTNSDNLLHINLKNYYFKRYEFHELCMIFPLMSEQELNDLADDIRENNLFDPITLYEGKILDGKCR